MHLTWSGLLSMLIGFLGLSIMIIVHELGHLAAAKLCGIRVEALSFGFGPALVSWGRGETKFRICAIPFGGSTKMAGRDDLKRAIEKKETYITDCEDGSLYAAAPWRRILTYLAGPVANFVFAVLCFTVLQTLTVISSFLPAQIRLTSDTQEYASEYCAAAQAGLETGDLVLSVNGEQVKDYFELQNMLSELRTESAVTFTTERGEFTVYPYDQTFGILPYGTYRKMTTPGIPFFKALGISLKESLTEVGQFLSSIRSMLRRDTRVQDTFKGTFVASESIGELTERGFAAGFNTGIRIVLYLLGSVSVSLAVVNLLPISALDGGLIIISLAELIARRPLPAKVYVFLQVSGLIIMFIVVPIVIHIL